MAEDEPNRDGSTAPIETAPWAAPPLLDAISIRDGRTGQKISWGEMLADLAKADVVFLGETHLDETTHRAELGVFEGLIERRGAKVVLSMEMFERDVQSALDRYLAGEIDERTFLAQARPWSNYRTAYRPLIETARRGGIPVVAANYPAPLRRQIAMQGKQVLENLTAAQRNWVPEKLHPNTPDYWKRVDNAVRGHLQMMRAGQEGDDQRLDSTQTLWDNAMGEACAKALDDHPGATVVHVNGGFHTAYWDGTARQLKLRRPDAKIRTISMVPVMNPGIAEVRGKPVADYVIYTSSIASDINEGRYSVTSSLEQKYRLSLPPQATSDQPVPLLIWLGDDGLNSQDGLALWKKILGDEVAIAVPEPRYKEQQGDLSLGGRWFWPDSFAEDIHSSSTAVERMWGYLLRHYPINPNRVCIAGQGTGGTVAAAIVLQTDRMPVRGIAWQPRRYQKLKDLPLPLPEYWGDDPFPDRALDVYSRRSDASFWQSELDAYGPTRAAGQLNVIPNDPWAARDAWVNAIRTSMGLEPAVAGANADKRFIVLPVDSARARHWAWLKALSTDKENVVVVSSPPDASDARPLELTLRAEDFRQPGALPLCPGPFGGTTVLVVPDDLSDAERQTWLALANDDPIAKTHRFHRLRVATLDGPQGLAKVLGTLQAEHRNNVLIVPVRFCADAQEMTELRRRAAAFDDSMTLHWLPGLGGQ